MVTEPQSDQFEVPQNWNTMTDDEKDQWVTEALTALFAGN